MIIEVWYRGLFVKSTADAVPIEISNHTKAVATSVGLNRLADVAKSVARSCCGHRVALSEPSCVQETLSVRRNNPDGSTRTGIREIPVELRGYVDIDEVALAKMACEGWNTMSGLVIDTDARGSGKVVSHSRGRSRTVSAKGFASNRVEFSGCDAGPYGRHHCISSFRNDSSRSLETFEIFVTVDRHCGILRSAVGAPRSESAPPL